MQLPPPEARLAGCVWLPRILTKARAFAAGTLPEEYAVRFCGPGSLDSLFQGFFSLTKEQITQVAALSDAEAARWFQELPTADAERIAEWNHIAVNLGRPGFPLAERLPIAPDSKYGHLAGRGISTIFEMLNADEEES